MESRTPFATCADTSSTSSSDWLKDFMSDISEPDQPDPFVFEKVYVGSNNCEKSSLQSHHHHTCLRENETGIENSSLGSSRGQLHHLRFVRQEQGAGAEDLTLGRRSGACHLAALRNQNDENLLPKASGGQIDTRGLPQMESAIHSREIPTGSVPSWEVSLSILLSSMDIEERTSTERLQKWGLLSNSTNTMEEDSSCSAHAGIDLTPTTIGANEQTATPPLQPVVEVLDADVSVNDVLSCRGGKSNNNLGNKLYLKMVADNKRKYQATDDKDAKQAISKAIVEHIHEKGRRFLKKETDQDPWRVMNKKEAMKKVSQALREKKAVKQTLENP
jgi:hypothetical protein